MAQQQLSGTIVVIIIAVGVQACIIVFIFLKRQVQRRLAMHHRRGPYTSICSGAPKVLRRETDRLLNYVQDIRHEPRLQMDPSVDHRRDYRRQIILSYQAFEDELADLSPNFIRPAGVSVRSHLLSCTSKQALAGGLGGGGCWPLVGADPKLVQHVCDDYDAARHHYEPIDRTKFKVFLERLDYLRTVLRTNKAVAFRNSSFLYQQVTHHHPSSSSSGAAPTPPTATTAAATSGAAAGASGSGSSPTRKRRSKPRRTASGSSRGSQSHHPVSSVVTVENNSNEQTNVV